MKNGRGSDDKEEGILKLDLLEVYSSDWKYFSGGNGADLSAESPNVISAGDRDILLEKDRMSVRFF